MFDKQRLEESKKRQNQWRKDNPNASLKERLNQASVETQRMLGLEFGLHNALMMLSVKLILKYNMWKNRKYIHAGKPNK